MIRNLVSCAFHVDCDIHQTQSSHGRFPTSIRFAIWFFLRVSTKMTMPWFHEFTAHFFCHCFSSFQHSVPCPLPCRASDLGNNIQVRCPGCSAHPEHASPGCVLAPEHRACWVCLAHRTTPRKVPRPVSDPFLRTRPADEREAPQQCAPTPFGTIGGPLGDGDPRLHQQQRSNARNVPFSGPSTSVQLALEQAMTYFSLGSPHGAKPASDEAPSLPPPCPTFGRLQPGSQALRCTARDSFQDWHSVLVLVLVLAFSRPKGKGIQKKVCTIPRRRGKRRSQR